VNFVGGSIIDTDRLGTFIYVENMHTEKECSHVWKGLSVQSKTKPVDLGSLEKPGNFWASS
jgi:hypothetical protein